MAKIYYWIQFYDWTVIKVRYYQTRDEAQRVVDELSDLCYRLMSHNLILDYRFEIICR